MKSLIFLSVCALSTLNACSQAKSEAQKTPPSPQESSRAVSADQKAVEDATMQFIEGADKSDVAALDAVMHTQYRAVLNRIFGDVVTTMDKSTYLKLISDKKIGGVARLTKILGVSIVENIAAVELMTSSPQAEIHSFLHFIKEPDGKWRLVGDVPFMKTKG
jgi:hypothetical protein